MNFNKSQEGFTLTELVIAMAIFSTMMVMLSVGIIQVMRIYQSGVASRRTQQAARLLMEDITREVRAATHIPIATTDALCLEGTQTIYYQRYSSGGNVDKISKRSGGASCQDQTAAVETFLVNPSTANNNLKVRRFTSTKVTDGSSDQDAAVRVTIQVSTGSDTSLQSNACIPGAGSEFCATTQYVNSISLRGRDQ